MADLLRPIKTGGTRNYEEEFALGNEWALDKEVDNDFNTIYNAWNTQMPPAVVAANLANYWIDDATHASLLPYTARNVCLAAGAAFTIGDPSGPTPSISNAEADAFYYYAGFHSFWDMLGNELGRWNATAGLSVLVGDVSTGGIALSTYRGSTPPNGALQFDGTHVVARIGGVWTQLDGQAGGTNPIGPAGGDLTGNYPNPTIAAGAVSDAEISNVTWAKVTGAPTSFPPTGSATGDLFGTYPSPQVAQATGNFAVGGGADSKITIARTAAVKGHLDHYPGFPATLLSHNVSWSGSAWARDDATKVAWRLYMSGQTDDLKIVRTTTAGVDTTLLAIDNAAKVSLSTPSLPTIKLEAYADANGDAALTVNNPWGPQDINKGGTMIKFAPSVGKAYQVYFRNAGGSPANTEISYMDMWGNFWINAQTATKATGTLWANPSDERMKRNIADYGTGLEAIKQLRPVTFQYNGEYGTTDDGRTCYGFIAQEVEPIMPECVGESAYYEGIKTLDQSNVILALVNAVKELAAKVGP